MGSIDSRGVRELVEEVESYERLKRGDFNEYTNFAGFGKALIAIRIALGLSQRYFAEKLDVHESQESRDERNEYHGVTVERANRILEALQIEMKSAVVSLGQPKRGRSRQVSAPRS